MFIPASDVLDITFSKSPVPCMTQQKLKECFKNAFALDDNADVQNMTYEKDAVWDSVGHMRLVAIIETTFNIMFTTEQILDLSSYNKAVEIIGQHGISLNA